MSILLLTASSSLAGGMHQGFVDLLARAPRSEPVTGMIMIQEQIDFAKLEEEIQARGISTRAERHRFVIETAKEQAARTQAALLASLEGWREEGRVRSYRSFWVTNMVQVEALPEVFDRVVGRSDVGTIYPNDEAPLRLGWDDGNNEQLLGDRDLPNNLICVNLQPAWDLGFKGQGRLVGLFDSGADGTHPALASRWRGLQEGVEWWEAWKDPYTGTTFPYDSRTHGTHVLGIMVGEKPDGTPIGVAPQALWMAAGATIEFNVAKIIECYEWAVDPDGDPETIDDVPDVVNNSWGTSADCSTDYWNAIDLVEAAGIVNTIAVDNSGPNPMSVNSPESRAASPTVNWGVGNVNPHQPGYPLHITSGRGPSPCDSVSIKPEVTAPGTQIYSTLPAGGYGTKTGTSMACPHTSGAVVLLRQVDPDLTVDEIKLILMATSVDRGPSGEDNDYGWGIIDIGAAVDSARHRLPRNAPANLAAAVSADTVTLTWDRPTPIHPNNPLLIYRIFRAPIGEGFPQAPIDEIADTSAVVSYIDPGLAYGQYHYVVTALYEVAESEPSNEAVAAVYPNAPPQNLTASVVSDSVTLQWDRPEPIDPGNPVELYRVYRAPIGEAFPVDPIAEVTDTASVVTHIDPGVPYSSLQYTVTALYQAGESDSSRHAEILETTWMRPPRDLAAAVAIDTVRLTWARPEPIHPDNPPLLYRIYRAPIGEAFPVDPIGEVPDLPDSLLFVDLDVPDGTYEYAMTTLYTPAESDTSGHAQATVYPYGAPRNLAASVLADSVTLQWERPDPLHPDNPVLLYRIYRALIGESFPDTPIAEVGDTLQVLTYIDRELPFAGYQYAIRALYTELESDLSNVVEVPVEIWSQPPQNLTAAVAADTVTLAWQRPVPVHPENGIESYRLYRALLGEPFPVDPIAEVVDPAAIIQYVDPGMPLSSFHYAVTALYAAGESDTSNHAEVHVEIWSQPPQNLTASVAADTVTLSWERPAPVHPDDPLQLYRLYRAAEGEPFGTEPLAEVADPAEVVAYVDPAVAFGGYHYAVTALYASAESDTSNHVVIGAETWTGPPWNLTAAVASDTVRLEWERPALIHPSNGLLLYRVYRALEEEGFPQEPLAEVVDSTEVVGYLDPGVPYGSYHYVVTALYESGESGYSNEVGAIVYQPSDAGEEADLAAGLDLWIAPNPFNPITVVRFRAGGASPLTVTIYDIAGSRVRTLVESRSPAIGEAAVVWDGTDAGGRPAASGAYFVRVEQAGRAIHRHVVLLK